MKPADVGRELLYPMTDMAVLVAMITFALLAELIEAARVFGIWLAIIILPAFFRYALYLLEARAHGQSAPVPTIEMFSFFDNFWALFPAVFLGAFIWLDWYIGLTYSQDAARWLLVFFLLLYPASLGVLGVTRSPLASLNPVAMIRMIKICGADYVWIPLTMIPVIFAVGWMTQFDLPFLVLNFSSNFAFFLFFTLTGAVLQAHDVVREVDIETPIEANEAELAAGLIKDRQKVANHAYGFINRGNREGGFSHIRQWLEKESARDEAYQWFFLEMLRWETNEPALFFAQEYLRHLLRWKMDNEALKLIARCLHENPRWKPGQAERDEVNELATRHGRDDLIRLLSN